MRTKQDSDFEHLMNKCDGNSDVSKECKKNANFKAGFLKSLRFFMVARQYLSVMYFKTYWFYIRVYIDITIYNSKT